MIAGGFFMSEHSFKKEIYFKMYRRSNYIGMNHLVLVAPPLRACIFNFFVQSQRIGLKFCLLVHHPQTQK